MFIDINPLFTATTGDFSIRKDWDTFVVLLYGSSKPHWALSFGERFLEIFPGFSVSSGYG